MSRKVIVSPILCSKKTVVCKNVENPEDLPEALDPSSVYVNILPDPSSVYVNILPKHYQQRCCTNSKNV